MNGTCLNDVRTTKLLSCYSTLQMLQMLINKTDHEPFKCWSKVAGEEALNDEAE